MRTASTRFVIARVIFQRRNTRATHACRPPRCPSATREERAREGRGERRGGGRCAGRNTGRGAGPGLRGPGGARPPRPATTAAAAVFAQLTLRWGRNWAAQWHLAWAVGKRFRGCRAKRLCVHKNCRTPKEKEEKGRREEGKEGGREGGRKGRRGNAARSLALVWWSSVLKPAAGGEIAFKIEPGPGLSTEGSLFAVFTKSKRNLPSPGRLIRKPHLTSKQGPCSAQARN